VTIGTYSAVTPQFIADLNSNFTALLNGVNAAPVASNNLSDLTDTDQAVVNLGSALVCSTLAALKALTVRPAAVIVQGETSANDGWGGVFMWVANDATTPDDAIVVECTAGDAGRYKRLFEDSASVKWFGAKGDGATDDSAAVTAALAAAREVIFPEAKDGGGASYLLNTEIDVPSGSSLSAAPSFGVPGYVQILTTADIDLFTVSDNTTFSGLYITHSGSGHVLKNVGHDFLTLRDCVVNTTKSNGTDPAVYNAGSYARIQDCSFTNNRVAEYAVVLDRITGVFSIEERLINNVFAGTGKGIWVGSADNSARPEGIYLTNNGFVLTNVNLMIEQVLGFYSTACIYDQGNTRSVVLKPTGTGIDSIKFIGGYMATPNELTNGIALYHDNTNAVALLALSLQGVDVAYSGKGISLGSNADGVSIFGGSFNEITGVGVKADQSKNVALGHNRYRTVGSNVELIDGAAGGPFLVDGEMFSPSGAITLTRTTPSKFKFGPTCTGKALSGWGSISTNSVTSPTTTYLLIPHGLAAAPALDKIVVSLVCGTLVIAPGPTLGVISADATNITVQVFFTVAVDGTYYVNAYSSV
jgi:hypothetical protein